MKRALAFLFVTSSIVGSFSIAYAQHAMVDDKVLMTKLKEAAPPHILEHATVMNMTADGKMKVIQQGNNGWTCMDPGGVRARTRRPWSGQRPGKVRAPHRRN